MVQQMKLKSARLENIFCYDQLDIELQNGVSVFAGANGSGKSSFLEAVFFVLFGSSTNTITGRSLNEVLRQGEKKGFIEAEFELGDHQYNIHLAIKKTGDRVGADGNHCVLKRDDGEEWTGVKIITAEIESLLHMDSEDFANCLYVRQGEVNRLIDASSKDRQSIIDRLLRLTKIDEYEKRLKDAMTATKRRNTLLQGSLSIIRQELEQLEAMSLASDKAQQERTLAEIARKQQAIEVVIRDEENQLQELESSKSSLEQAVEQLQQIKIQYQSDRDSLTQRGEEEQSLRDEISNLEAEFRDIQTALTLVQQESWWPSSDVEASLKNLVEIDQAEFSQLDEALQSKREELAAIRARRQGQEEIQQSVQRELEQRKSQIEQSRIDFEQQQIALESLQQNDMDAHADLEQHEIELTTTLQQKQSEQQTSKEQLAREETKLQGYCEEQERSEKLLEQGKCPTCHQPVSAETLSQHTGHLDQQIVETQQQCQNLNDQIADLAKEIEKLESQATTLKSVQKQKSQWVEAKQQFEKQQQDTIQLEQQLTDLSSKLSDLVKQEEVLTESGRSSREQRDQLEQKLEKLKAGQQILLHQKQTEERIQSKRQHQRDFLQITESKRKDLNELEAKFNDLREQYGTLNYEELQANIEKHEQQLLVHKQSLNGFQAERDQVQNELGRIETQLKQLAKLKEEQKTLNLKEGQLAALDEEIQQLQQLYSDVKLSQRQKNLSALNFYFNNFFKLMDPGAAYDSVRLSDNFDIEVIRSNDAIMSPSIMSGGERALINLALRAAIHRVISEAGGMLLPLFFDEPTVFLDENHIQQLERLFENLGQTVGQVVVVSHEASLVESADHEYLVSKDGNNIGQIEKVR